MITPADLPKIDTQSLEAAIDTLIKEQFNTNPSDIITIDTSKITCWNLAAWKILQSQYEQHWLISITQNATRDILKIEFSFPKSSSTPLKVKNNLLPAVKVNIIESERGWGQKIDSVKHFDTREEAEAFCVEYNKENNKYIVPDWYMYAIISE